MKLKRDSGDLKLTEASSSLQPLYHAPVFLPHSLRTLQDASSHAWTIGLISGSGGNFEIYLLVDFHATLL